MIDVAYIGGLGRSGSTLLERITGRFDGVCVLGEVVHLFERGVRRDELCGCALPFSRCPFWREVGEIAFGGWGNVDVERLQTLATLVDRTRDIPATRFAGEDSAHIALVHEYVRAFAAVYEAAAKVSGARLVVDSSKHPSTAYALRRSRVIELKVVHLVRDPRGVAYSWTKVLERPEAGEGKAQPLMHRYPPGRAAALWVADNLAFELLGRSGVPVWRLHYERLMADPVAAVHALADFLGLSGSRIAEFVSQDAVQVGPTHQISGNHVRFQSGELQLRRDDAWHRDFPAGRRRQVTAITAPMMLRYGYLGPRGRRP